MTENRTAEQGQGGLVFPIVLILAGAVLLADKLGMIEVRQIWRFWPLGLIALGVHMLLNPKSHCCR